MADDADGETVEEKAQTTSGIGANVRASRLRQSILKKAFEGKLVPQGPCDESASVLLERIKAEKAKREAEGKAKKGSRKKAGKRSRQKKQQRQFELL